MLLIRQRKKQISLGRLVQTLSVILVLSLLCNVRPAQGQTDVVQPDEVTTPTPAPILLPTPTPAPVLDALAPGGADGQYGSELEEPHYTVQEGDTLWTVALEMGLDLNLMPCLIDPHFRSENPLVIGDRLVQPEGQMVCHEVLPGETLESISLLYLVDPDIIASDPWNRLANDGRADSMLDPGRFVRIVRDEDTVTVEGFFGYLLDRPIGEAPEIAFATGGPQRSKRTVMVPEDWPYGSGYFEWPTYGWITQVYRNDHKAVDIAAPPGAFVMAADRGEVVRAGWNNQGYGMFVIVDHNIDYVTLYSHLQDIFVHEGEIVSQGQVIGTVGSTGNSTGPHLHFEVRDFGSRINPLEVLLR